MSNPNIKIWRPPLRPGEVKYLAQRVHFGYDDVRNVALPQGMVEPEEAEDGWLSFTIPDNTQNRRLCREGYNDSLYTVVYPEDAAAAEVLARRRSETKAAAAPVSVPEAAPAAPVEVAPVVDGAPVSMP